MTIIPHWPAVYCKDRPEKLKVALETKGLNTVPTIKVVQTHGIQKGHNNVAVDALSMMHSAEILFLAISVM